MALLNRACWKRAWVFAAVVALLLVVPAIRPQVALAATPASPPAPVNPAPKVVAVTAPGPTQVSGNITTDTVWSPQGSPYVITKSITVEAGVELTLLPGTVVKLSGSLTDIGVDGELVSIGDPGSHVVITSYLDDSVGGDTDGDGGANSPAPGNWYSVIAFTGGAAVFDYTDVRYGGNGSACDAYGELSANGQSELVVSNSSVTDSANAAVYVGTGYKSSAGIYDSSIGAGSCMGVAAMQPGELDVTGNTFDMPSGNTALFLLYPNKTRVWFNTVNGLSTAAGPDPTTRAMADVRFNQLGGTYDYGTPADNLNDWSDNWWGFDANAPLPACMDPTTAADSVPAISVSSSTTGCPAGEYQVTGYTYPVLPALSSSLQVLPAALREAAAPRFGPVDTYSGALVYQASDISVPDAGQAIAATRTYRSDQLSGGDAGTGWKTAFDESLTAAGQTSTLSLPDGTSIGFSTDPAAGYTPAPGVSADLSTSGSGSTVTSPGQVSYQFDTSGQLSGMNLGDPGHHLTVGRSGGQVSSVTGVSGRSLSYSYNGSGQLASVTDQSGRRVSFSYDGSLLSSVTGVDGKTETYSYDSAGRLTQVTTPGGLVKLAAGYDSSGRVAWIQQEGSGKTTFTYDDADGERLVTLPDGTVITQTYDWAGRLVTEQLGSAGTHVVYDGEGHVVADVTGIPGTAMTGYGPPATLAMYNGSGDPYLTADPMGNVTTTTFNAQHKPLVTTRPDGTAVSRSYDSNGRLVQVTDPLGSNWSYAYNGFGEVTSQTDPLGRVKTMGYASNGDATSATDETGAVTQYGYDAEGWPTSVTDPLGNQSDAAYTSWGTLQSATSPLGGVNSVTYNADRQVTSATNPLGKVTSYGYDTAGRLAGTTDPLGGQSTISYDTLGRPVRATDPRGSSYQRTYTPQGWTATSTDPDGKVTSYAYDPAGRVIRVTDPAGAVTQTVYDRNGNVTEVDRPDGSVQTWTYDTMNRKVQYTLPGGGVQKYAYDAAGHLTSVLGPRKLAVSPYTLLGTTATYDAAGRLSSTTDAAGTTTTYSYDDAARTVTATDPLGTVWKTGYDAAGHVVSRTDGAGDTTGYAYDADGNQTSVTDPTGLVTSCGYDLSHQVTSVTNPAGLTTSYARDADGRVTKVTYPAGDTQAYGYDATGNVTSYSDRDGNQWTYTYDAAGHTLTSADPLGDTTSYTYNDDGRLASVTGPSGVVTYTAYDPAGRPAVTWDAAGASWVTAYDGDGNVTSRTDPDGVSWTYTYNTADQLTAATWSGAGSSYSYTYDNNGRLAGKSDPYASSYAYDVRSDVTQVTDALGNSTAYSYDGAGRLLSTTLPGGQVTSATYDAAGRILSATDGAGDTSRYSYDNSGQLATLTLPRGGVYGYTYDSDGRPATQTDPLANVTAYTFDGQGQPTSASYPSGHTVTSAYDAAGRLTSTTASTTGTSVTRSFGYDPAGQLTSATVTGEAGSPPALSWGYNSLGQLDSSTDALGTTSYAYDAAGRLATRTPPAGSPVTVSYNAQGLPSTVSGPVSAKMSYNSAGQVTLLDGSTIFSYDKNGRLTGTGEDSATYNANGQIATLTQSPPGNLADNTTAFSYDNAGRLSSAVLSQNGSTVSSASYGWDADSNRTETAVAGGSDVTTSYNAADQPVSDSAGTTYSYDADGNLTSAAGSAGTTSYSYDPYGVLTSAVTPGGSVSYTPDALGRTAARTSGTATQTFSYDGTSSTLAGQQSGGVTVNIVTDPATGQPLGEATAGGPALLADPTIHGDVARLVNPSTGATAWTAVYDPFGAASTTGSAPVGLEFQSMLTDPVTGLVNMGARSYDPASGAFTTIDSVAGAPGSPTTLNRYLYGNGDPVDNFDPTGHWPKWLSADLSWAGQQGGKLVAQAGQQLDTGLNWLAQQGGSVISAGSQAVGTVSQGLAAVEQKAAQVVLANLPSLKAAAVSIAAGGLVFLGCAALTGGAGSVACATFGAAAGGAVYGAMTCPPDASTTRCALTGAAAGTVTALTGGAAAELGASALTANAVAAASGNATAQLLTTGRIDPAQLATATLTGAFTGKLLDYAGSKLTPRPATAGITEDNPPTTGTTDPASQAPETAPEANNPADTTQTQSASGPGSGPASGIIKLSKDVQSTGALNNFKARAITAADNARGRGRDLQEGGRDFIYDPVNRFFAVSGKQFSRGHPGLVMATGADEAATVGGELVGGPGLPDGSFLTDERSGHYPGWTDETRQSFVDFMSSFGYSVDHSPTWGRFH